MDPARDPRRLMHRALSEVQGLLSWLFGSIGASRVSFHASMQNPSSMNTVIRMLFQEPGYSVVMGRVDDDFMRYF